MVQVLTHLYLSEGDIVELGACRLAVNRKNLPQHFQLDSAAPNLIRGINLRMSHGISGKEVRGVVRTGRELAGVLASNQFAESPGSHVAALFIDGVLPSDPLDGVTGLKDEQICLGKRELYVLYPNGMGTTRLRIPSEKNGTARNMNTVAKLASMAAMLP